MTQNYYQVRLGTQGRYVAECRAGQFIGVDYGINQDLTGQLPENWQEFNQKFRPIYLQTYPEKSRT